MNPPTDPVQLVVYGVGTVLVVLALKLWDRRRDGKLQRAADSAASHAATAAAHAGDAAAAAGRVEENAATAKQAGTIIDRTDDANGTLLRILSELGELRGQIKHLEPLPERVAVMEHELDALILSGPVRRRQDRA